MPALSIDLIFDAAVRIQLREDRFISLKISRDAIAVKFPTTRRLAEFLEVPHYYVLPYFAMMEQDELVMRAERVGILTTEKGSRKYFDLLRSDPYRREAEDLLGRIIFEELRKKIFQEP
jgi:Mn-dependent DtxR family transcriptional regulator